MKIVAVLEGKNYITQAFKAKKLGADLLELRIDRIYEPKENLPDVITAIKKYTHLPIIATFRPKREGGRTKVSEIERLKTFTRIASSVDFIDIELGSKIITQVKKLVKRNNKKLILSYHNFYNTPHEKKLNKILTKALSFKPAIVKIVTYANKYADVTNLIKYNYLHRRKPLTTFIMGPFGKISRLISPLFGSKLVYCYIGKPVAPGQFSLAQFKQILSGKR